LIIKNVGVEKICLDKLADEIRCLSGCRERPMSRIPSDDPCLQTRLNAVEIPSMTTMPSASPATDAEPVPTTVAEAASPKDRSSLSWFAALLISVNLLLAIAVVAALLWFGSLATAVQVLGGRPLVVDATTKSFGVAEPGQTVEVTFNLVNYGSQPCRVVGTRLTCGCTVPQEIPFSIGPGETGKFRVVIRLPDEMVERDTNSVRVYTNIPSQVELRLTITGQVRTGDGQQVKG